jgi:aminoglycoside phosphotransferase family enzyme/predicted kinase
MTLAEPSPILRNEIENAVDQRRLVAALANPARFGPACTRVTVLETHISYVLLTGQNAFKLKKAVNLGFLDFTTLAARRFYCEQELRLNRRLAPALYLDVVAITGTIDEPAIGGGGPVLEYAVKMREFPQEALASRVLARNELTEQDIDALAVKVAAFHIAGDRAPVDGAFGTPQAILNVVLANFDALRPSMTTAVHQRAIARLETWTKREHAARSAAFFERRQRGFVRECHGDLHLGNIAVIDGDVTIFDCIEFNDAMRWIDVMSEVAFTAMDLQDRGHSGLAHRFVNAYLEITGDYAGLSVLRFYLIYRALVRAKIALMRASQLAPGEERTALLGERDGYVRLAASYARTPSPAIVITHGVSGCGKTTLSQPLLEQVGAVRIRTDVERKRLHGIAPGAHGGSASANGLYSTDATHRTYDHALLLADSVTAAGFVALVDGTFLQRWQRDRFRELAAERAIPFIVIDFSANETVLRQRIVERRRRGTDASDADLAVLDHQLRTGQPLGSDELEFTVTYDANAPLDHARSPHAWRAVIDRIGGLTTADAAAVNKIAVVPGR